METGTIISLVLIAVAAIVVIGTIWGLLSRYRRSAPDELLVVFGKAGKMKTEDGTTIVTPSKIIQGGGAFVWPIIQDFKKMSMKPIQIKVNVDGIDSQAIPMHLPVVLTTAISSSLRVLAIFTLPCLVCSAISASALAFALVAAFLPILRI